MPILRCIRRWVKPLCSCLLNSYLALRAYAVYLLFGIGDVSTLLTQLRKDQSLFLLRTFGADIARDCDIEAGIVVHGATRDYSNLHVGTGCHIGRRVFLDVSGPVVIGDCVTVSMQATVITHTDVGNSPLAKEMPREVRPVYIEDGAYIGAAAIILPGVVVRECAFVGAGAVVTRDVESHTVVAGNPARIVRRLATFQSEPVVHVKQDTRACPT